MTIYLICALAVLFLLITGPLWIGLIYGKAVVCGATTSTQCFKDWISVMAGPLAIAAALIAAWPVFDQLDESRVATRIALASIIRIGEQDLEGAMTALRAEQKQVEDSRKIPEEILAVIEKSEEDHKVKNDQDIFVLFEKQYVDTVASCRIIAQEMASKPDRETVMTHRKNIEGDFNQVIESLEQIHGHKGMSNDFASNDDYMPSLKIASKAIISDIVLYDAEYHKLDADLFQQRNALASKRMSLTATVYN